MKVQYIEYATASGKIGGQVAGVWKGINWRRKKITPSNPRTAAQTNQRSTLQAAVAIVTTAFQDAATRSAWIAYAAANGYRSKNGLGTQFLPAYQAALTTTLPRIAYGFGTDPADLPTETTPGVPVGAIAVSAEAGHDLEINYGPDIFGITDGLYFWLELTSPNKTPSFQRARRALLVYGVNIGGTNVPITDALDVGSVYNVWVTRYQWAGKEPTPPLYLGQFTII